MNQNQPLDIVPPGWVGGFAESNPAFAYPNPDLSSLPMLGNMDNINLLERQQGVEWPEFSWETEKGNADPKRCFQMFAPYISRLGYTDTGRVYSIICPQQGVCHPKIGCMNVEVTVTGQRGWVNETTKEVAADMTVEGKIWFSPFADENPYFQVLWKSFKDSPLPFPKDKAHAIVVTTCKSGHPEQRIFPVRRGQTDLFKSPDFAIHNEAWAVANVEVEIGPINKTGNELVDDFNQLVMDVFNLASGNMLQPGNLLSWNVWFTAPKLVDKEEWRTHAERWRKSIDEGHGSPDGPGTIARYFDGTPFDPVEELIQEKVLEIIRWIWDHL
ncbi:MAG: hypothetical protein ABR611_06000 [Chthoniobacterales bacterium]